MPGSLGKIKVGVAGYGNSARVFHLPFINRNDDLELVAIYQRRAPGPDVRHCTVDLPDISVTHSDFLTLQEVVASGALGEITDAELHFDVDLPPWVANMQRKTGEGLALGLGTHTLDQALVLFGQPDEVSAHYRNVRGGAGAEDTFDIALKYGPKLVLHIKRHGASMMPRPLKYFFRGTKGTYIKFGTDPQEEQTNAGLSPDDPNFGMEPEEAWGELYTLGPGVGHAGATRQVLGGQGAKPSWQLWQLLRRRGEGDPR